VVELSLVNQCCLGSNTHVFLLISARAPALGHLAGLGAPAARLGLVAAVACGLSAQLESSQQFF
jgi:hypothetical protein